MRFGASSALSSPLSERRSDSAAPCIVTTSAVPSPQANGLRLAAANRASRTDVLPGSGSLCTAHEVGVRTWPHMHAIFAGSLGRLAVRTDVGLQVRNGRTLPSTLHMCQLSMYRMLGNTTKSIATGGTCAREVC